MLQLDATECQEVLTKTLGFENARFSESVVKRVCEFQGFLGEYFQLEIFGIQENGDKFKNYYFAKSICITNKKQRQMLEESGIFRKECKLYASLIKELSENFKHGLFYLYKIFKKLNTLIDFKDHSRWYPYCYLIRDDLIILEDLQQSNYRILPKQIQFEKIHIKETLKAVAKLHAASLRYEDQEIEPGTTIGEKYKDILFETSFHIDIPWCSAGLKVFSNDTISSLKKFQFQAIFTVALEKSKYGLGSTFEQQLKNSFFKDMCLAIELLEKPSDTIKVFSHRDLWKNNLMFKFDVIGDFSNPQHCILLDYQIARYLPIPVDVLMAIVINTRRDHRQKFMEYYLEFYYEHLKQELAKEEIEIAGKISLECFKKNCQDFMVLPLTINAVILTLTQLPSEFMKDLKDADFNRICNIFRDDVVLDFIEKDANYKEYLLEAVEELIEYLYVK